MLMCLLAFQLIWSAPDKLEVCAVRQRLIYCMVRIYIRMLVNVYAKIMRKQQAHTESKETVSRLVCHDSKAMAIKLVLHQR